MVGEVVVGHGNLRANPKAQSLHRRYMHLRQHEELVLNQNLYPKYSYLINQLYTHHQLLAGRDGLHAQLRREYK